MFEGIHQSFWTKWKFFQQIFFQYLKYFYEDYDNFERANTGDILLNNMSS